MNHEAHKEIGITHQMKWLVTLKMMENIINHCCRQHRASATLPRHQSHCKPRLTPLGTHQAPCYQQSIELAQPALPVSFIEPDGVGPSCGLSNPTEPHTTEAMGSFSYCHIACEMLDTGHFRCKIRSIDSAITISLIL